MSQFPAPSPSNLPNTQPGIFRRNPTSHNFTAKVQINTGYTNIFTSATPMRNHLSRGCRYVNRLELSGSFSSNQLQLELPRYFRLLPHELRQDGCRHRNFVSLLQSKTTGRMLEWIFLSRLRYGKCTTAMVGGIKHVHKWESIALEHLEVFHWKGICLELLPLRAK